MIDFPSLIERELRAGQDPESHVEADVSTFHPSQISKCKRQATISKLGLEEHDLQTLGYFEIGTRWHEWLEQRIVSNQAGVEAEKPVEHTEGPITFVGTTDVYDRVESTVYDFKTRSGWYRFDPPNESHVDQIHVYMAATGATQGQVVYLSKKDLTVKTWPSDGCFTFDAGRYDGLVSKALDIRRTLEEFEETHGHLPETVEEVPFEPCGCWLCDREGDGD